MGWFNAYLVRAKEQGKNVHQSIGTWAIGFWFLIINGTDFVFKFQDSICVGYAWKELQDFLLHPRYGMWHDDDPIVYLNNLDPNIYLFLDDRWYIWYQGKDQCCFRECWYGQYSSSQMWLGWLFKVSHPTIEQKKVTCYLIPIFPPQTTCRFQWSQHSLLLRRPHALPSHTTIPALFATLFIFNRLFSSSTFFYHVLFVYVMKSTFFFFTCSCIPISFFSYIHIQRIICFLRS